MPLYSSEDYYEQHWDKVERYPLATDCVSSGYERLIHDEPTWRLLQKVFYEQTTAKYSYHHRLHARHKHLWHSGIDDELVTVEDDEERGRSIYAIKDIPKGTKVWYDGEKHVINNGYWYDIRELKSFLERIPHDLQCDILLWAYAFSSTGKTLVECNLDEASFFNHGERPELVNISRFSRAIRDISKGEELLMDYSSFIAMGEDALPWWDDIRQQAWSTNTATITSEEEGNDVSTAYCQRSDDECILGGYVKYGAPNPSSRRGAREKLNNKTEAKIFVDASMLQGDSSRNTINFLHVAWTGLASLFLAVRVTRNFRVSYNRRPTRR